MENNFRKISLGLLLLINTCNCNFKKIPSNREEYWQIPTNHIYEYYDPPFSTERICKKEGEKRRPYSSFYYLKEHIKEINYET